MSNVPWIISGIDSNLFRNIVLWGFDSFSCLMESVGFSCIVLSWLSEIFEFFAVLQGELGPTGFKMEIPSFAGFSIWSYVFKISR